MKYRLQAFLIHALLSALVLCAALALVALVWYPAPLFWADGGSEVIVLMALVDVVVGPALTFVVYQKGKKSLKFDLGVIAALQLAALAYGSAVMYQQRPVFVAFVLDKFYTVTAEQVETLAPKKLKELAALTPQASNWVYVGLPQDKNARYQLFLGQGKGELALSLRTDLYQPLSANNLKTIISRAADMDALFEDAGRKTRESDRQALEKFLAEHRTTQSELAFLPFIARYRLMYVAYRKADAQRVGFLEIKPDLLAGKLE